MAQFKVEDWKIGDSLDLVPQIRSSKDYRTLTIQSIRTITEKKEYQVELFEEESGFVYEGTFIFGNPFKVVSKIDDIQLLFTLPSDKMIQDFPGIVGVCYKTDHRVQTSHRVYRSQVKTPTTHAEKLSLKTLGIMALAVTGNQTQPLSKPLISPIEILPHPRVAIIAGTGLSAQIVTPDVVKLVVSWEAFLLELWKFASELVPASVNLISFLETRVSLLDGIVYLLKTPQNSEVSKLFNIRGLIESIARKNGSHFSTILNLFESEELGALTNFLEQDKNKYNEAIKILKQCPQDWRLATEKVVKDDSGKYIEVLSDILEAALEEGCEAPKVVTPSDLASLVLSGVKLNREAKVLEVLRSNKALLMTTNYDNLLELSLERVPYSPKNPNPEFLSNVMKRHDKFVVHMHGTFDDRTSFVLTRRDYERTEDSFVSFVLDLVDRGLDFLFVGAKGTIIDAHFMELWSVLAQSGRKLPKFRILLADVEAGFKDKIKTELNKMNLPSQAIDYLLHSISIETYPTSKLPSGRTDHSQMSTKLEELLLEYQ